MQTIIVIAGILIIAIGITINFAWIYSRFIFSHYLKRRHPEMYKKLVIEGTKIYYATPADKTYEIEEFRKDFNNNLGDEKLRKMKIVSELLWKIPIIVWFCMLFISIFLTSVYVTFENVGVLERSYILGFLWGFAFCTSLFLDFRILKKLCSFFTFLLLFVPFFLIKGFDINQEILIFGFFLCAVLYSFLVFTIYFPLEKLKRRGIFEENFKKDLFYGFLAIILSFLGINLYLFFSPHNFNNLKLNFILFIYGNLWALFIYIIHIINLKNRNVYLRVIKYFLFFLSFSSFLIFRKENALFFSLGVLIWKIMVLSSVHLLSRLDLKELTRRKEKLKEKNGEAI